MVNSNLLMRDLSFNQESAVLILVYRIPQGKKKMLKQEKVSVEIIIILNIEEMISI